MDPRWRFAMADERLLIQTLSEFAATLVKGFAISDVLHDLAERVTGVLGVESAGVYLQESRRLHFITAIDERSASLERAQEDGQAGPCVDAWRSGHTVAIPDLAGTARRWDSYLQAARKVGIVAVAGVPMRLNGQSIGVLNLHHGSRRDWSEEDLRTARVLADIATSYVINASRLERQRRINEQLQEALDSRVVIEQAKGILAAERCISVEKAFEVLRRHARSRNATLRTVAEAVVNLGLRP